MAVSLVPVRFSEKTELRAMLDPYLIAHADQVDPDRVHGDPTAYGYFDLYWEEPNRRPYWILAHGARAGFVLVNAYSPSGLGVDHAISEFYVQPAVRRGGVGMAAALATIASASGVWELQVFRATRPAMAFWPRVLDAAPVRRLETIKRPDRVIHRFTSEA